MYMVHPIGTPLVTGRAERSARGSALWLQSPVAVRSALQLVNCELEPAVSCEL